MGVSQVGAVAKNLPANARDTKDAGSIPGSKRSSGEGNGNPLQHSGLAASMDRTTWQATVQGVTKSQTELSTHTHILSFGLSRDKKKITLPWFLLRITSIVKLAEINKMTP